MINGNLIFYFFQADQKSRIGAKLIWIIDGEGSTWDIEQESTWTLPQC
jgi:hypothetical protein